jgi:phage FluMu gp28-like protein
MIAACQNDTVGEEILYDDFNLDTYLFNPAPGARCFAGMDIGRKKDLSVIDIEEQVGDVFWNRLTLIMPKVPFSEQRDLLLRVLRKFNCERACIDATGIGAQIAEDTVKNLGTYRAEQVEFTLKVKQDLAVRIRHLFEDKLCRIAVSRKLRDDLHAVKKTTTAAGNVRFDAERTKEGHADRFWAKSLSFMASDAGVVMPEIISLSA